MNKLPIRNRRCFLGGPIRKPIGKRMEMWVKESGSTGFSLGWQGSSLRFPSAFNVGKSLEAALPALGKPVFSLLFYLDYPFSVFSVHRTEDSEFIPVITIFWREQHIVSNSDQQIDIFPANRNRNRFAEPTSAGIGIGMVCEFQNMQIGKGITFVRWEVFANYSQIPKIFFF